MKILVTGATGYIGGRLVPRLVEAGHDVRVLVRDPDRVAGREWSDLVEVHVGDLLDAESLVAPLAGVDVAYYLVHSMTNDGDFEEKDRLAAENFSGATEQGTHVIYLGGLLPPAGEQVSKHLRSRAEVGQILLDRCSTTEFRAGPIIGSGSASFELVRHLTERLPIMVTPKWVSNLVQPIAVRNVLDYLIASAEKGPLGTVEIGADSLTFKEMMLRYAEVRGLRRTILPVPVLTPSLASHWAGLVTPIPARLARPLIEGVVEPLLADTTAASKHFPDIDPMPYDRAVSRALRLIEQGEVETRWTGTSLGGDSHEFEEKEGLYRSTHSICVDATPDDLFARFVSIGGERGWYRWDWLWVVRGWLDILVGGPGLRRGRRHPTELFSGEALDFWRVEEVVPPRLLRLRAEMKLPGRAWLQWETRELEDGSGTELKQSAIFAPKGLWGRIYWWSVYPFHLFIFKDMIEAVGEVPKR